MSPRARLRQWWHSRLPQTDSITLTQRNVYILPTRPGLMLAVTLLALLVASINYQLNLGFLLTFMLAGSAAVGMHVCHGTLRGLTLRLAPPEPCFAGQHAPLEVHLDNPGRRTRHAIGLAVHGSGHWSWTDVDGRGTATVQIAFQPGRRGLHRIPPLTAETRFPLGTFRVWTIWRPAAQILVYPAPEPNAPPLPPGEARRDGAAATQALATTGEFDGVRGYRRGDPLKLVVWKKAALALSTDSGELVSRDAQQAQRQQLWLDFARSHATDTEHRIARLTAWVLMADRAGLDFGLRLPGREIASDSGEAHRRRCLEALALC
ncbi:MAG: DUF58 domain-containing protein [Burkholderiaceae bacterium]|nr:DUF58 domain-containing protein [Burkholderiaceae bacterium]